MGFIGLITFSEDCKFQKAETLQPSRCPKWLGCLTTTFEDVDQEDERESPQLCRVTRPVEKSSIL